MKRLVVLFVLLLTVAIIIPTSAQTMRYKMIDPGGAGIEDYWFHDLNDNGQAVGCKKLPVGVEYVIWDPENRTRKLSTLATGMQVALCINDPGTILCSREGSSRRYLWNEKSGFIEIPETFNGKTWGAVAIDNSGNVLMSAQDGSYYHVAGIWDSCTGSFTPITVATTGNRCSAQMMNNKGQIVGYLSAGSTQFLWDAANGTQSLGDMKIYGINDYGYLCGGRQRGLYRAIVRDNNGVITELYTPGDFESFATSINNRGQVLGCVGYRSQGSYTPYLWENGVAYDLSQMIDMPSGWSITYTYKITDSGYILAYGRNGSEETRVILAPVPEPATILALVSGLGGLGLVSLRRRQTAG